MSPGTAPVSHVTGRRQAVALRFISVAIIVVATTSLVVPAPLNEHLALAALVMVAATPLLRVAWLIYRWAQEGDRRFAGLGVALLAVVAFGAIISALRLGR
ncbi:MAG: hypothetical protein ACFCVC_06205 [Acidimicrobiia bacterium]